MKQRPDAAPEPRRIGKTELHLVPPATFAEAGADVLAAALRSFGKRDLSVALSGGSTPGPIYEALAGFPGIPWERIGIYFADERAVPPDDPASNYPLWPDGFAEPGSAPALPQSRAEIMAGRIPITTSTANIPGALQETVIGPLTAREINLRR